MKIALVIMDRSPNELIYRHKMTAPPAWKERVYFEGQLYKVDGIIHDVDEEVIKVLLRKTNDVCVFEPIKSYQ